ncbi:hypothetical protein PTTG_27698 [Puccinia triticina 1-1 BBBD Race 1]|uniref:Uncharacterized protein n=1 Tax=Puccinia triticina (isolate 1-1 / race 1 (BBBD)) TaxID=630390 RepID=A0A180GI04_PUCT1|nr:hypothetical protein PTTG_27698 [Puccinia triticina 1-1 BBBD Race 1]
MIIKILSLAAKHPNLIPDVAAIPSNPRTIIQRADFNVQLSKKICCRVCFKLFDLHPSSPWRCDYKQFNSSNPCDEELFVKKKIYQGNKDIGDVAYHSKPPNFPPSVVGTPRCVYLSQSILTWMTWLLSKPDTEKAIDDWIQTNQDLKDQGYFSNIQHGEAFMNTKWKNKPNSLKLGLSLFVDWFNPRGNKISGKLSHMCIAGITPGPYSPDPHSFNHLLTSIVDELITLDAGILQLSARREKAETIHSASNSKNAKSETAQEEILKKTGVRWSELNRLVYWDPSRHLVLGVMHNWLEGILQGHWRFQWRFGSVPAAEAKKHRRCESQSASQSRKRAKMDTVELAMWIDNKDVSDKSEDDEDILLDGGLGGTFFSANDIDTFRTGMSHVVLPPGVPHLPHNLGDVKHGKLSASQWHALFVFIVPLVLCEMYVDEVGTLDVRSNWYRVLENTAHLVACTNVVFAQRFKSGDIKRFEMHYKKYLDLVGGLFKGVKVQPNHHFSLHIPQQMASWGPLAGVAEFPGERLIGFLQKINTNNKIDEMHRSMITRGCRLQRMMADPDYTQLTKVEDKQNTEPVRQKKPIRLLSSRYELLYNMVLSYDTSVVDCETFPVPQGCWILSGNVKAVQSLTYNGVTFGSMAPCNCVVVKVGGQIKYYLVQQCYKYPHKGGEMKEFMVVSPIMNQYPKATNAIPTRPFRYLLFLFGMVVGTVQDKEEVVVPSHVVYLAAY